MGGVEMNGVVTGGTIDEVAMRVSIATMPNQEE